MIKMTPRERIRKTLRHEEPDRIPLILGGDGSSTMTVRAHKNLLKYLGIDAETKLMSKFYQIVFVDERILKYFEIDIRPLVGKGPKKSREMNLDNRTYINEWGMKLKMPEGGYYYDIIEFPLKNASIEDLDNFLWPDPFDEGLIEGIEDEAKEIYEHTDYAIMGSLSLGQSIFEQSWYLRGMDTLLMDLIINKEFAHALFRRVTDIQKTIYGRFLDNVGKYLDIVRVADDLSTQQGLLMSPQLYREMIK